MRPTQAQPHSQHWNHGITSTTGPDRGQLTFTHHAPPLPHRGGDAPPARPTPSSGAHCVVHAKRLWALVALLLAGTTQAAYGLNLEFEGTCTIPAFKTQCYTNKFKFMYGNQGQQLWQWNAQLSATRPPYGAPVVTGATIRVFNPSTTQLMRVRSGLTVPSGIAGNTKGSLITLAAPIGEHGTPVQARLTRSYGDANELTLTIQVQLISYEEPPGI